MDFDTRYWELERANYDMDTETILEFFTTREILGEPEYQGSHPYSEFPAVWYLDSMYIDILEDEYALEIIQEEWSSQCLERLEIKLARYAVEEGIIDRDEFLTRMYEMLGRNIGGRPQMNLRKIS